MTTTNLKGESMKRYSFFVNGELKRSGTKEEIYEISNKENCLCKADFEEVDEEEDFFDSLDIIEDVDFIKEQKSELNE